VSKLVAGREKDIQFVAGMIRHGLVDSSIIADRVRQTNVDKGRIEQCLATMRRIDPPRG